MTAVQNDRRPAIWPWLVMPLITLTLYYGLDRLRHQFALEDPPQVQVGHPAADEGPENP